MRCRSVGAHGEDVSGAAAELITEGLVSVISSDAHGPSRPPALTLARAALTALDIPAETIRALTASTPRSLLAHGIPAGGRLAAGARLVA